MLLAFQVQRAGVIMLESATPFRIDRCCMVICKNLMHNFPIGLDLISGLNLNLLYLVSQSYMSCTLLCTDVDQYNNDVLLVSPYGHSLFSMPCMLDLYYIPVANVC